MSNLLKKSFVMSSRPSNRPSNLSESTSTPGLFNEMSLWERVHGFLSFLPTWRPSSAALLEQSEQCILDKEIKSSYTDHYIPIRDGTVIRTIAMEPTEELSSTTSSAREKVPLVMIHGFGAGFLQFYKNIDHLHDDRRLLAFDLPGFGRSSRVQFPKDPVRAESQFVDLIEKWREEMGVKEFVLLGHSLGGYLATAYSIKHPERVTHLVLVDPWGFSEPPSKEDFKLKSTPFQRLSWNVLSHMRPFTAVRAAGPWGPDLIKRMRKDLARTFGDDFLDYLYHCNARQPTGEEAFYSMQYYFGWARRPMLTRMSTNLDPRIPITVISGAKSWVDAINRNRLGRTADLIKEARPEGTYVGVELVADAGHHIHAEKPQEFNRIVKEVLARVDAGEDREWGQ